MMDKKQKELEVIVPLAPIGCAPHINCCHWGSDCPGTVKVLPSGAFSLMYCGC